MDKFNSTNYLYMFDMFSAWEKEVTKLKNGEITKEEYDQWRYTYPKIGVERFQAKLSELRTAKRSDKHE